MHEFEIKIMEFMKKVGKTSVHMDDLLLKPATKDIEHYLRKVYEDDPNRPFTIRMSNIGKPLCQLQMEKAKAAAVEDDWHLPLRFMYGGIIEGLTVSVLRHAGVNIIEEQTKVSVPFRHASFGRIDIEGTLDLVIDGKVWDIKSASPYAFQEKFASYESMKRDDNFGYMAQLYGYAKGRDIAPGGWIVVDKSSGNIKVVEVPFDYAGEMALYLTRMENNVKVLTSNADFKRCFEDKDETFKKRFTGNKVLQSPCTFCKFKYSCWNGLRHLPVFESTAYERPYRFYTQITSQELLPERA